MQQACESVAEQPGEVVRNDEVGREEEVQHLPSEAVATPWKAHTQRMMSMEGRGGERP